MPSAGSEPGAAGHRLAALDGLRGMGILMVVAFHYLPHWPSSGWVSTALLHARDMTYAGVDLFFVLSGYLITGILLNAKGSPGYFRTFYLRRSLRIFPLYFAVLTVSMVAARFMAPLWPAEEGRIASSPLWAWIYCVNVAVAWKGWFGYGFGQFMAGHFWSLSVEEHFYLVWPAVVLLCEARLLRRVCVACILGAEGIRLLLLAMHVNTVAVYVLTPCRIDSLALGGLIALQAREGGLERVVGAARAVGLLAAVALFIVIGSASGMPLTSQRLGAYGMSLYAAFAGALIVLVVAHPQGALARVFAQRWLGFWGRYSYGLYVIHGLISALLDRALPQERLDVLLGSELAAGCLGFVLKAGFCVVLSIASFHLLEKPFLSLKDRIAGRETQRAGVAQAEPP
jgi:peptidoglycan/LPS O-acetylase OafA/YrhL